MTALLERREGLRPEELRQALELSLAGRALRRVLIVGPDFTRLHSGAGLVTNLCYHILQARGCAVDILIAQGTHAPMTAGELTAMYGDIPREHFFTHNWRADVQAVGRIPADYLHTITEGLWNDPICAEMNRRVLDPSYDLVISAGQVVPHEVIGMSGHAKNLLVGVGGSDMINKSHMVGAVYGMERMMGRDHTPVRQLLDYAVAHFLKDLPVLYALTVCTAPGGKTHMHGLFLGEGREPFERAVSLAQQKNIDFVEHGIRKCVVYLDPKEFKSTWLGNKAIYRTRMAVADGGELLVLAPGVCAFGEDARMDHLIRKYGYRGRQQVLEQFGKPENDDLRADMGAAAHLIHGSSDGRFHITYAVRGISQAEIRAVGFAAASYDELSEIYNPRTLAPGCNMVDGEPVYFVPNPALGLWIDRSRFQN